jgi:hypothetical protein
MRTISHSADSAERPGHHTGGLVLVVRMPRFGPSEPQRQALAYLGPLAGLERRTAGRWLGMPGS